MKHAFAAVVLSVLCSLNALATPFSRYKLSVDTTFHSEALHAEKNIQVTLPAEYQKGIGYRFPVIVIFDREFSGNYAYLLQTIDYLTSTDQMPSSIVIGVFGNDSEIAAETHIAGENVPAEQFLIGELLPAVRSHYQGSEFTTLIGQAEYASLSTWILTRQHPDIHAVIAANPELLNANLVEALQQSMKRASFQNRTYFRCAFGSNYQKEHAQLQALLKRNDEDKTLFNGKSVLFDEANPAASGGIYLGQALYEIFAVWSANQETYFKKGDQQLITAASQINGENSRHYGTALHLSLGALNGKAWMLYNDGKFESAIEAWNVLLTYYPNFSEAYLYIAYAMKDLAQPIENVLRQFEENYDSSLFYSEQERKVLMDEYRLLLAIPDEEGRN